MFTPCTSCGGDPLADVRSNVIAHTTQAWADHKATR
jgi:hypothetical protein